MNGVPVVATDCGGTRDFVVDDKNGYLVKVNDDQDMVDKALKILSSDELHKKMRTYARKFVKDNFSEGKINSIFKIGLTRVYPELKDMFEMFDGAVLTEIKTPSEQIQTI